MTLKRRSLKQASACSFCCGPSPQECSSKAQQNVPLFLKFLEKESNLLEVSTSPRVISMPGLAGARWGWLFRNLDEKEQPHSVHDHCQRVTLGHSFFAQNNKEEVIASLDCQNGKVAAAIKNTSRPRCPFMAHHPKCQHHVAFIECIACINQKEAPLCRRKTHERHRSSAFARTSS